MCYNIYVKPNFSCKSLSILLDAVTIIPGIVSLLANFSISVNAAGKSFAYLSSTPSNVAITSTSFI